MERILFYSTKYSSKEISCKCESKCSLRHARVLYTVKKLPKALSFWTLPVLRLCRGGMQEANRRRVSTEIPCLENFLSLEQLIQDAIDSGGFQSLIVSLWVSAVWKMRVTHQALSCTIYASKINRRGKERPIQVASGCSWPKHIICSICANCPTLGTSRSSLA